MSFYRVNGYIQFLCDVFILFTINAIHDKNNSTLFGKFLQDLFRFF